jgi:hypothetical protein
MCNQIYVADLDLIITHLSLHMWSFWLMNEIKEEEGELNKHMYAIARASGPPLFTHKLISLVFCLLHQIYVHTNAVTASFFILAFLIF